MIESCCCNNSDIGPLPRCCHVEQPRLHIPRASAAYRPSRVVLVAKAVEEYPTLSPGTEGISTHRKLIRFST